MKPLQPIAELRQDPWEASYVIVQKLLEQLINDQRDVFVLNFAVQDYDPFPYLQGRLTPAGFEFEVAGTKASKPSDITSLVLQAKALGWQAPSAGHPNIFKLIQRENSFASTSRYLITTMRVLYSLQIDVWMCLGSTKPDLEIAASKEVWHMSKNPRFFCLPNQNADAVNEQTDNRSL
jgi:hypothetical protein